MPELPEVQTTVSGLQKVLPGLTVRAVWSDLPKSNPLPQFKDSLKSKSFFTTFTKTVTGPKILSVERRAKNILIHLSNKQTILIHMKMTGHLLYGSFIFDAKKKEWVPNQPGPLNDPFNRFLHFVVTLSNGKQLALSDMRKFAKITIIPTNELAATKHLSSLGPEVLAKTFTAKNFSLQLLKRKTGRIKNVLMDQTILSGIGNIYSDEALWLSGIHPEELVSNIPQKLLARLFKNVQSVLKKGIDFKGDSTSDYRTIDGTPGKFSAHHNAYRKTGTACSKRGCKGVILRKVVGGRSAHYCSSHQKRPPKISS